MEPECLYFIFHHRATLRDVMAGNATWTQIFGHVEVMGYTVDDTWFFYDPGRYRSTLLITHMFEEVENLMAAKYELAETIIKLETKGKFGFPAHLPMNCVTQCAALAGFRAFTPQSLKQRLLNEKGEIVHGTKRRSRREKRPAA